MSRSGICAETPIGLLLIPHIHSDMFDRYHVRKYKVETYKVRRQNIGYIHLMFDFFESGSHFGLNRRQLQLELHWG